MQNQFSRTELLIGKPALDTLAGSRIAVFGIGGVGSYVTEVLARSGIGELDIIDNDRVCPTNINRQLYALLSTIGKNKVDVAEERILDINSHCIVRKYQMFYLPENADAIDLNLSSVVIVSTFPSYPAWERPTSLMQRHSVWQISTKRIWIRWQR